MARNEPLNRKPPKQARQTSGKATKVLIVTLVVLVVAGIFLHRWFPPELPDSAQLTLRGGKEVTLTRATAQKLYRDMRTLKKDPAAKTFTMADSFWIDFKKDGQSVGELAIGVDDGIMHVDLSGYSHMKQSNSRKDIDYAAMAQLYRDSGGQ